MTNDERFEQLWHERYKGHAGPKDEPDAKLLKRWCREFWHAALAEQQHEIAEERRQSYDQATEKNRKIEDQQEEIERLKQERQKYVDAHASVKGGLVEWKHRAEKAQANGHALQVALKVVDAADQVWQTVPGWHAGEQEKKKHAKALVELDHALTEAEKEGLL